jgi:mono/diheme cytochrome c family protein
VRLQVIKASAIAGFAVGAIACGSGAANQQSASNGNSAIPAAANASPAVETAAVKSGMELYRINCTTCHKETGKGGKVTVEGKALDPDDLTSVRMKAKSDEKLYSYVADGIVDEGMPAFKDTLSADEIRAVVAHMRVLQK